MVRNLGPMRWYDVPRKGQRRLPAAPAEGRDPGPAGRRHGIPALVAAQKVNYSGVAIWVASIACDHRCAQLAPDCCAALPPLVLTFGLTRLRAKTQPAIEQPNPGKPGYRQSYRIPNID